MIRPESYRPYLEGKSFDNILTVEIDRPEREIAARSNLILDRVKGKAVVHLGCADHIPLIEAKMKAGEWLHAPLTAAASTCLGVDIDREAVDVLRTRFGVDNVVVGDVTGDPLIPEVEARHWDYLVIGEVLEHIDDPVSFLRDIRTRYEGLIDRVIITVPNALRISNFENVFRHRERVNSDHRYWFTPYTLAKVVVRAGMQIEEIRFCEHGDPQKRGRLHRALLARYPAFRAGLYLVAGLK